MLDTDAVHTIIAGDFNCSPGSRFFKEYVAFAADNNLIKSDIERLNNVFSYISDDGTKMSWLDHILCSVSIDKLLCDIVILNEYIVSDHKPVSFSVKCNVEVPTFTGSDKSTLCHQIPVWHGCDNDTIQMYEYHLDQMLKHVDIPHDVLGGLMTVEDARLYIDKFYNDIMLCVSKAVSDVIPVRVYSQSEFNIPGWNTYVKEKHESARNAFLIWHDVGKPKYGYHFDAMKQTRAVFKLALRYCKNNVEQLKADACAESLYSKDACKFWNNVYKMSNNKSSSHVVTVNGAFGAQSTVEMWKGYFEKLYCSTVHSEYQKLYENKISESRLSNTGNTSLLSVHEVMQAVASQKRGKAPGPDGIHTEAFIFGGHRLSLYLSILFNIFLEYGYVPDAFHRATIIPLVKCKNGDLSDVNNYRAIALSNSVSKILESALYNVVESTEQVDEYQFGFKKKYSCAMCTHVFKKTVGYYCQNGSHVFTCFIDFNKAFDNVDYWLLFCKLLDNDSSYACLLSTRLLAYWYSHQQMAVRWQNRTSEYFNIEKGVRQGGILSPFLFRFYIRSLIASVTKTTIGCNIGDSFINLLAYADDMVLLAPSWRGLQSLLNIVEAAAIDIKMTFNTKKTVCMIFNPNDKSKIVSDNFPAFTLSGSELLCVSQFKYLGHIIDNKLHDDSDVNRELKCLFMRTNVLARRFKRCNVTVKVRLFQSFCICFYDTALWCNFSKGAINKLESAYNRCIKTFFGFDKYSSVTNMLMEIGLPSFNTVIHNHCVRFENGLNMSDNRLIQCVSKL
jgi:hypothetical protein